MVTGEDLSCFDLLQWLRNGSLVADRLGCSQSTVSRRVAHVSQTFGLRFRRVAGEWQLQGNDLLLAMERGVHQVYRLMAGAPLRLECTAWDVQALALPLPPGWMGGVFDHMTMARPLQLLRERVIDAWINNCWPDLPQPDDPDLQVFELSRFPVWLMAAADHPLAHVRGLGPGDLERFPSMALPEGELPTFERVLREQGLWNTALRMRRYSPEDWQERCADQVTMSFGNCVSTGLMPHLVTLDRDLNLISGQALVVRRDVAEQGAIQQLLELLRSRVGGLRQCHPVLQAL
jgi:DNA-binding transcriptional LysR family regulator